MKKIIKEIIIFALTIVFGIATGLILSDLVNAWVGDRVETSLEIVRAVDQSQDVIYWEMDDASAWREYQTLKANGIQVRWEVE